MMKKLMKTIVMIAAVLVITTGYSVPAHAQVEGETKVIRFMTAMQNLDAKAKTDSNAQTVFSFEAGASVIVTGETQDGWYIVYYQGVTGYIDKNTPVDPVTSINTDAASQSVLVEQEMDIEALNAEMEALHLENKLIIEEVEMYRAEARRSRIWGTIIVLLVIAIFAVGIVSTVRAEKRKKEDEDIPDVNQESISREREEPQESGNRKRTYNGDIIDLDKE